MKDGMEHIKELINMYDFRLRHYKQFEYVWATGLLVVENQLMDMYGNRQGT